MRLLRDPLRCTSEASGQRYRRGSDELVACSSLEREHKSLYGRRVTNSRLVADFIACRIARCCRGFYAGRVPGIETSGIPSDDVRTGEKAKGNY